MIEGLTVSAVAGRLGCSATTVLRRLAAAGVARRPRGSRPRSRTAFSAWSAALAYAVGLIATDGNLARDGRHLTITSKDHELLEGARLCLRLGVAITPTRNGQGQPYFHLQWSDRAFHTWLVGLGLMPAKSLRLGPLQIPDEFFADFLRGCIDGDGSIIVYTDRYLTEKSPKYVYQRLFVRLASASRPFLGWVQDTVSRLKGLRGAIITQPRLAPRHWLSVLQYAKHDSIKLLNWLYAAPDAPCLARKKAKADRFLIQG